MSSPSDADRAEDERVGRGGGAGMGSWLALGLPLVLVIYCLSIGPAARLHRNTPAARPAIEAFYKPLTALIQNCRPASKFFEWYIIVVWKVK